MDVCDTIWHKALKRRKDIVARKIAGAMVLVPIRGKLADMQEIFSLNTVGEYIWDRLDGTKSLREISDEIVGDFEVEQQQADADVKEFVAELMASGLVAEVA